MATLPFAPEREHLVLRPLVVLGDDPSRTVHFDAVDVLDVGRAAPGRHQAIGRRAAILVGEDHGIAVARASFRRLAFVPHEHRHIGEAPDRVRPRVDERRERQGQMLGRILKERHDRESRGRDAVPPEPGGRRRCIDVEADRVASGVRAAKHDGVVGAAASDQRQVL